MNSNLGYSVAAFSHIGHRKENQDRYCVLSAVETDSLLVIVADGMGGHEGGALAAQTIIETAAGMWKIPNTEEPVEEFLHRLVNESHAAVKEAGNKQGLMPRSTLAALYLYKKANEIKAMSIHSGDCRIIQFSGTGVIAQTIDHSLAQLKVLQGRITQEEAATDPDQNKVISNIGGDDNPEAEITTWDLSVGDHFVVCSDGFWGSYSTEDIMNLYQNEAESETDGKTLEERIEQLFLQKLGKLSKQDNTTVVMLSDVNSVSSALPPGSPPLYNP